jgi:hypothetical protein
VVSIPPNKILRPDLQIDNVDVSTRWRTHWYLAENVDVAGSVTTGSGTGSTDPDYDPSSDPTQSTGQTTDPGTTEGGGN